MKSLKQVISEKLILNKNIKSYKYQPKTRDELKELVDNLIKERGNEADLNDIDTSKIDDMNEMFIHSNFNGDISKWDVSNVKSMRCMFLDSSFNGDISQWNVSKVENMHSMFENSKFTGENGDISKWDISNVEDMGFMFTFSPLEKNPPKWYHE